VGSGGNITVNGVTYTLRDDTVYRQDAGQASATALSTGAPVKAFNVDGRGAVYALQASHQLMRFPTGNPQNYDQVDYNVASFALDGQGAVYTLSQAGNVWKFPTGTPNQYQKLDDNVASFAVDSQGAVYTLSNAGNLWTFPTGTPGQFQNLDYAAAPDGSLWFLGGPADGHTAYALYRFAGGQVVQQQGTYTQLLGVASDGNVWVANQSGVYKGDGSHWTALDQPQGLGLLDSVSIGDKVLQFAMQHINDPNPVTTPGNIARGLYGECTDLVERALQYAGGKGFNDFPVNVGTPTKPGTQNYVWGTLVLSDSITPSAHGSAYEQEVGATSWGAIPVRPGDIIQFADKDHNETAKLTSPDGTVFTTDHHSAIIEKVNADGSYVILEQNWDNGNQDGRHVRENTIRLTEGTDWIYQPVAK
jgi:hypothetical protein